MCVSSNGSMHVMCLSPGRFGPLSWDFHNVVRTHSFLLSPEGIGVCSPIRRRPWLLIPVDSTAVGDNAQNAWAPRTVPVLMTCEL